MTERKKIILDGDPGHDDAIAWMLAKSRKDLEILAVTSVCGNQTIEKTTYNARRICTLLGITAPFGMGRPTPLCSPPMTAGNIHGESGLDGPKLPEPKGEMSPLPAVELMARTLKNSSEKVWIVPTGPLTNVATLLLSHPECREKIAGISLMGGGIESGNWSCAAEFNILVDPEAADIVFTSGLPLYMAGLDVTEKALIFPEDFERIRAVGNPVALVVAQWLEFFYGFHREIGYAGAPVHDPCAVVALVRPDLLTQRELFVRIEKTGKYCRGTTVGDLRSFSTEKPNVTVAMNIDREGFVELLVEAVKTYDRGDGNE